MKSNSNFYSNKKIIFVIVIGVLLRLILFFMIRPYSEVGKEKILQNDAYGYHILATELQKEHTFAKNEPYASALRTPGYPIFIAFFYGIFGGNPAYPILAQIVIEAVFIFLIFLFVGTVINKRVGLLAALFYAINPIAIQYSNSLLSDSLFTFFVFLNYIFLWQYLKRNKIIDLLSSAFILAIAAYIRPVGLYLIFFNILFVIIFKLRKKENYLRNVFFYLAAFYFSIFPWMMRNKIVHGHFFFQPQGIITV